MEGAQVRILPHTFERIMEIIEIKDGGKLFYSENFLKPDVADALFDYLKRKVCWNQNSIKLFNKTIDLPRLTAWYADAGVTYKYSRISHSGTGWTDQLTELKRRVEQASQSNFNSVLLNLYRDGNDSVGWHSDNEKELGKNPLIASVSLGSTREFVLKHIETEEKIRYHLSHGSLLVMGGTTQDYWLHSLLKTKEEVGERINLTFRQTYQVKR